MKKIIITLVSLAAGLYLIGCGSEPTKPVETVKEEIVVPAAVEETVAAVEETVQETETEEPEVEAPVTLTILDKEFFDNGTKRWIDDYLILNSVITNNTDKDILAIKVSIVISDLFGNPINESNIVLNADDVFKPGDNDYKLTASRDKSNTNLEKFFNDDFDKFKITSQVKEVAFADGTTEKY